MRSSGVSYWPKNIISLLSISVLTILACGEAKDEERKEEWVKKEVIEKIVAFKAEKKAECIAYIIAAAETEVDSILSQKDLFGNLMDKNVPQKPVKPEYVPLDSTAILNHKVEKVLN